MRCAGYIRTGRSGHLSGLCTIFASVVTAAQARQEHAQARWPEVTARRPMRPESDEQRTAGKVLHPLPLVVCGRRRAECGERLFEQCSFAQDLAVPAQPDWAARTVVGRASAGDADRRALRSRRPQESSADGDPHAARRTANAKQSEATGSSGGKFPGPADDCANHTAAIPSAKRIFFNAAEPIGCPFCLAPIVAENRWPMVPQEIRKERKEQKSHPCDPLKPGKATTVEAQRGFFGSFKWGRRTSQSAGCDQGSVDGVAWVVPTSSANR
jgi:hypothetical protein